MPDKLREGFTTGSAATGAALAALQLLRHGSAPDSVRVPLPPFADAPQAGLCGLPVPRGWLELPRLRLDTTYPLGLFRAWAYWRARQQVLVWPALDPHAPPLPDSDADGGSRSAAASRPVDAPDGLRPWRRGDAPGTGAAPDLCRYRSEHRHLSRPAGARLRHQFFVMHTWGDGCRSSST